MEVLCLAKRQTHPLPNYHFYLCCFEASGAVRLFKSNRLAKLTGQGSNSFSVDFIFCSTSQAITVIWDLQNKFKAAKCLCFEALSMKIHWRAYLPFPHDKRILFGECSKSHNINQTLNLQFS